MIVGWKIKHGVILASVCVLLLVAFSQVSAHGCGQVMINSQRSDNTVVTVCQFPAPAITGINHITVALSDDTTRQPILNREVTVYAQSETQTLALPATHDNATNRLLYEADFNLREVGEWQFEIEIEGVSEPLSFSAELASAPLFSAERIAAIVAVFAVILIWLIVQRTQ